MSVFRKKTQITNNRAEIINRRYQEQIMMQQEIITAQRSSDKKQEESYHKQAKTINILRETIKDLQQHNTILLKMVEQQQQLLNKNRTF